MSIMYTYVESEAHRLWTVGFHKPDGSWEPASDHSQRASAAQRVNELNGTEFRFVYQRTEPGLWTVGEYGGAIFYPESDHESETEAAARVVELNA